MTTQTQMLSIMSVTSPSMSTEITQFHSFSLNGTDMTVTKNESEMKREVEKWML